MIELTPNETRLLLSALRLLVGEVEPAEWLDRLIAEVNTKEAKSLTLELNVEQRSIRKPRPSKQRTSR